MIGTYKVFTKDGDFAVVYIKGSNVWMLQNWDGNGGEICEVDVNNIGDSIQLTTEEWFEINEVVNHIKL